MRELRGKTVEASLKFAESSLGMESKPRDVEGQDSAVLLRKREVTDIAT